MTRRRRNFLKIKLENEKVAGSYSGLDWRLNENLSELVQSVADVENL